MENESVSPSKDNHPVKKRRLSLSLKGKHRFQAASDNDLAKLSKLQVPKNTDVSTRCAMKKFTDWYQDYNARNPEEPCPKEVISPKCSAALLNTWLCVFISETRNQNGEQYPPRSLYSYYSSEPPMVPPLVPVDCQIIQVNNVMKRTMIVNSLL